LPTYKVYGSKTQEFYLQVDATGPDEAYDMANEDHVQWFEIEIDDPIEPHTVELVEQNIQLNKDNDDYPSMESGILIEGSN
jgi:hypothetical protein